MHWWGPAYFQRKLLTLVSESLVAKLNLRLAQTGISKGKLLEEWNFTVGLVIPNTTSIWQQTIETAEEGLLPRV